MAELAWIPPDEFDEFRLVRPLGAGAAGQVYLAHDSVLDRPVAVKFVNAAEDPVARAQLIQEARAIPRPQHPNGNPGQVKARRPDASEDVTSSRRHRPRRTAGTPLYMAPELWRGDPASCRSDLYSLGILLYELLTGRAPHRGLTMAALASAVLD